MSVTADRDPQPQHVDRVVMREIQLPLVAPFRSAGGVVDARRVILLELRDGSGAVAWSHGYADGSHLPVDLVLATARAIGRVSPLPLTLDIEDGYSDDPAAVGTLVTGTLLARTTPVRDARTQFYIAYSFYRQGWNRTHRDDALYTQGLETVERAIALAPAEIGRAHV